MSSSLLAGSAACAAEPPASPFMTTGAVLAKDFEKPPDSAKPWLYWFWMNGNITREGLTTDLESYARAGIGGVLLMEVTCGIPEGPVKFMSEEWRALFKHTVSEADRLGLQVSVNNGGGWSGSGGPWNTPENSMQKLVFFQSRIEGGRRVDVVLRRPVGEKSFYRDIVVLAVPIPASASLTPTVKASSSAWMKPAQLALDGLGETAWISEGRKASAPSRENPEYLQFDYEEAWPVSGLYLLPGEESGPKEIEVQCSDDGKNYRTLKTATADPGKATRVEFDEVLGRHFRVLFLSAHPVNEKESRMVQVAEIELLRKENLGTGTTLDRVLWNRPLAVDLTAKMDAEGRLQWDVPAGTWDVMRIGHASNGRLNAPAPKSGVGLECDKLSTVALDAHFAGMMGKLIADVGPLAGKVLTATHVDSWEVGFQNWTPTFREEFKRRRGYDPVPFLPGMLGRVVQNETTHRRFAWDVRRTINDLVLANYTDHLHALAQRHGLQLSMEAYGFDVHFSPLECAGRVDMPMGTFWAGGGMELCKPMASAAHIYGKTKVPAEAFTSSPGSKWQFHPATMKTTADWGFCEGLNRLNIASPVHQPWLGRFPGMTFGGWGTQYDRGQTWWEQSRAWHQYLSRCQALLQSGLFVADLCYLDIENTGEIPVRAHLQPPPPAGYDFDYCTAEVVISRMSVKDGRLVLPSGMSYRLLVLPPTEKMTPETLRKVRDLVKAGATVVATTRPQASPSLVKYPACDREVQEIVRELFGDVTAAPATGVKELRCGQGCVLLARDLVPVVAGMELAPDFETAGSKLPLRWIHRRTAEADFYFLSNPHSKRVEVDGAFRVVGRQPELWQAETGEMRDLPEFKIENGRTILPLRLEPTESVFVVFRKPGAQQTAATGKNWREFTSVQEITGPWTVSFDPKWSGPEAPVTFGTLSDWSAHSDPAIKYYSGTAVYQTTFESPKIGAAGRVYLDLGRVEVMAEVILNGKELGIVWKAPYRLDVTGMVKPGNNTLELRVVNLWTNRLIGDEQLPEDAEWRTPHGLDPGGNYLMLKNWPQWLLDGKPSPVGRLTFATVRKYKKTDPLLPSGLLGPVRVLAAE
ncbi:MAG: glycosyl hydrolase [bacterium]